MKKLVSITVMLAMMVSMFSISAAAKAPEVNHTNYKYTYICSSTLTISNRTANCRSIIRGYSGETTKIELRQSLEKQVAGGWWVEVGAWSKTFYDWNAVYNTTKSSLESNTYQLRTVAKVYSGSDYEQVVKYSSPVTI